MRRNILCCLFGHKWGHKRGGHLSKDPKDWFIEYCERCGVSLEEENRRRAAGDTYE